MYSNICILTHFYVENNEKFKYIRSVYKIWNTLLKGNYKIILNKILWELWGDKNNSVDL